MLEDALISIAFDFAPGLVALGWLLLPVKKARMSLAPVGIGFDLLPGAIRLVRIGVWRRGSTLLMLSLRIVLNSKPFGSTY